MLAAQFLSSVEWSSYLRELHHLFSSCLQYCLVAALGAFVGGSELVARYRDSPYESLWSIPGLVYIGINAVAAAVMLRFAIVFEWTFGLQLSTEAQSYFRALACGVAAMAILRTSLFNATVGGATVPIGFGAVLDVLIQAADRSVDRRMAIQRADLMPGLMDGVDFDHAVENLPAYCLALMQNLDAREQQQLAEQVRLLKQDVEVDERTKTRNLGLLLVNSVGKRVLRKAVQSIREDQKQLGGTWLNKLLASLTFSEHAEALCKNCFFLVPDTDFGTRADILRAIESLERDETRTGEQKLKALALLLSGLFGQEILRKARSLIEPAPRAEEV